jgi:hypothetical protein
MILYDASVPKRRRIPAMTGEQTRRVQDAVLKLASDWLSARGANRVRMAASA